MTGWGFPRPSLLFMRVMRGLWLWVACVCGCGVARRFESFALRCRLWGVWGVVCGFGWLRGLCFVLRRRRRRCGFLFVVVLVLSNYISYKLVYQCH
nr:MAG TPA: hypothetical protein [Caudoviricetes sp.]